MFGKFSPSGRLPITIYKSEYAQDVDLLSIDMRAGPRRSLWVL